MEQDLWTRYRHGDQDAGNSLAVKYLPAARQLARMYASRWPVDPDVLFSAALFGLAKAMRRFEPDRGLRFMTYATKVMTGRIGDDVRRIDHLGRRHRRQVVQTRRSVQELAQELGRHPNQADLHAAGVDQVEAPGIVRLSQGDDLKQAERGPGSPSEAAEAIEALAGVTPRERKMLVLRFVCGLPLAEIGKEFGVGTAAVSQSLTRILRRLRDQGEQTKEALLP